MASVNENIEVILEQAEILDQLVADFRASAALIAAAEDEIRKARPGKNDEMIAGRIRLAYFAHARMVAPDISSGPSVTERATEAWSGVS